jgi:hypothetical protein
VRQVGHLLVFLCCYFGKKRHTDNFNFCFYFDTLVYMDVLSFTLGIRF